MLAIGVSPESVGMRTAPASEGAPMPADRNADTSLTLLERLQKNPDDPQAWTMFIERYQPRIRRWCLTWGLQDSDADDVAQDVLVKLFAALRKFRYDPAKSFRAWLKTVTQHALADFVDARRKDPGRTAGAIDLVAESSDVRTDLERQMEDAFDSEVLELAMQLVKRRVKPTTWDAFALTAVEGLAGVAAAQKLQMPVAHVFVAKSRVQKMVRDEARALKNRLN
jgi:RNA polymerase sigma factor (sigma-70 family)